MFSPTMPNSPATAPLFDRLGGRRQLLHLLRHFYADVRQHRVIAPLFAAHVQDWPAHLEKIADFWSGATGGPPLYRGAMPSKHIPLGLEEAHFQAWLELWHRHCHAHLPPRESEELIALAEGIGQRLRQWVAQAPPGLG
jgi:hemoglobin